MPLVDIAKKISDDVISIDDAILAISVMDMKGNILASQFKRIFKDWFEVTLDDKKNSGTCSSNFRNAWEIQTDFW